MSLDLLEDQERLRATVARLRPTLLVLDPFVRLHRIDENASTEVAPVLAYLRDLERHFHTAVLLVHHARKGAAHVRAGQALRGSSELHAWGDSNLYLRRRGETLCLAIEHRAAPSRDDLSLNSVPRATPWPSTSSRTAPSALRSRRSPSVSSTPWPTPATPLSRRALRRLRRIRASTLGSVLARLLAEGRVIRSPAGYSLVSS